MDFVTKEYVSHVRIIYLFCVQIQQKYLGEFTCWNQGNIMALSSNIWKIYYATITSFNKKGLYSIS